MARLSSMPRSWQLQVAKNRLSEVVDDAQRAPQIITRRGKEAAVVLSAEHYARLVGAKGRLIDLLRKAPRIRGGLDVTRSDDPGRDIDLR